MSDATSDLLWVLAILFVLGIVWFYTGGPFRPSATSGPFLSRPLERERADLQRETTGGLSGSLTKNDGETASASDESAPVSDDRGYEDKVYLSASSGARESDPNREYLTLTARSSNKETINVSGWALEGSSGLALTLGPATLLPQPGQVTSEGAIVLKPGGRVIITTGRSPGGQSFLVNMCTGYLGQSRAYTPSLEKSCPEAEDERNAALRLRDACLDFVERIPRCTVPTLPLSLASDGDCQAFVLENLGYQRCVFNHKNDQNFYGKEWRVYLDRTSEMWKNRRETITLRDGRGRIVDTVSY